MVGSRQPVLAKEKTMIIRANEIEKYMELHGVEKVPLEAVEVNVPKIGYQKAKALSTKRLVVFEAYNSKGYGKEPASTRLSYNDAEHRRCKMSVPADFEFSIVAGAEGQKMLDDLIEYESGLESKFRKVVEKHNPAIQEKLKAAAALIAEAEGIAEKHGVPFRPDSSITDFSMSYFPENFATMFGNLDRDLVYDLTDASSSGEGYAGWMHSQTC